MMMEYIHYLMEVYDHTGMSPRAGASPIYLQGPGLVFSKLLLIIFLYGFLNENVLRSFFR
jgi:hypothetical protein